MSDDVYIGMGRRLPSFLRPAARRVQPLFRPQIVRHFGQDLFEAFVESFPSDAFLVNVGAGSDEYGPNVFNLDIERHPSIDVVGVAEHLPFVDGCADGVLLQAVLEHVADADTTLAEVARVLAPDGRVLIELPFIQGFHAAPMDYRRLTKAGLCAAVERHGLRVEESGVGLGPASAMTWIAGEFLALLLSGRSGRLYNFTRLFTRWLVWPLQWTDVILQRHPQAHVIASSVWVLARKLDEPAMPDLTRDT